MSLRLRLFLAMAAVAGASVLVTALTTRGGVQRVVEAYVLQPPGSVSSPDIEGIDTLRRRLVDRWSEAGGFTDPGGELQGFASKADRHVLLVDAAGGLVAAVGVSPDSLRVSPPGPDGTVEVEWRSGEGERRRLRGGIPLRSDEGRLLGTAVVLPGGELEEAVASRSPRSAIDRRIAAAAALALALALIAALLVARHVAEPVARLAGATRRLAAGDRSERIASTRTDEVGQLVSAFNDLADSLETSEGLRRRLVADVAHELRTPLAALQGSIEAMQDGLSVPDAEGLQGLHDDVAHLTDLVEELQELALAEGGEIRLERTAVQLTAEASGVVRALGLGPEATGDRPACTVSGEAVTVWADPGRVRQILTNLLSNAVHHAGARTVRVEVSAREAVGVVEITDDGVGIDPSALPHIFERLYRADTRSGEGSGLGLAITRELVRMHGGTIEATSSPGGGSTFRVELPRHRPG